MPLPKEAGRSVAIDTHEVTVAEFRVCVEAGTCSPRHFTKSTEPPCNYGLPDRDNHPMNCVDWDGAAQYCQSKGQALCSHDEWFAACRGPNDLDYPYGAAYQEGLCNSNVRQEPIASMGTRAVGEASTCEGGYPGLFDMVGNVSEWVDECKGSYCKFFGGGYINNPPLEDFASCKPFCAGNQKQFRSASIGFRCCGGSD